MKSTIIKTTFCAAALLGIAACASRPTTAPPVTSASTAPVVTPIEVSFEPAPGHASATAAAHPSTRPLLLADMQPSTQPTAAEPALPPGHPKLPPTADQPPQGNLPAGHPSIAGNKKAGPLPPGTKLPSGHPTVPGYDPAAAATDGAPASTQPAKLGSIVIQAVQGTANGPKIGSEPTTIELYVDGKSIAKLDTKLADDGTLRVNGVPLDKAVQPVITVTHAGVDYAAPADVLDAEHSEEKVDLTVYESTETAPAWSVKMRHVMVRSTPQAVEVTEMLAVDNPTDRAWIGKADAKGGHTTFSLALPHNATDVKLLGGFHDCCTATDGGAVTNHMAIVPGSTQYSLSYVIPATDGKAELAITAPVAVGHLILFVPEDATTITAKGLNDMGSMPMENGQKMRCYMGMNLAAQQTVGVTISDLAKVVVPKAEAAEASGSSLAAPALTKAASAMPQRLAVGGAALILVLGAMVMFFRSPRTSNR